MENLNQLFIESGTLMFAGMVFVFAFLGLLVVFINYVLAPLGAKYPDAPVASKNRATKKTSKSKEQGVSPSVVAAISAAVTQYRNKE